MTRHRIVRIIVLALTFILSSLAVNAQQSRAVPPNDNFITAKAITIGKSYSVPDIGAATNQIGEPNASCKSDTPIPNSVWFTFSQPEYAFVSLSTFGTVLATADYESSDTVLAVYTLSGPATFTEVACNDDANSLSPAQVEFLALAGVTYYVAAGTYDDFTFLPSSTLKLGTRMLMASISPLNSGFEAPLGGPGWKVKNGNDDTIVCGDPIYPDASGSCAFRFIGTPGLTTKLVQTLPFPSAFIPRKKAQLVIAFYVRVMDTGILDNSRVKVIVRYKDGTLPSIRTIKLTGLPSTGDYFFQRVFIGLKSGKVASIKFEAKFGAEDGVLMVDDVLFYYNADPATRGGRLPVPPAAQ